MNILVNRYYYLSRNTIQNKSEPLGRKTTTIEYSDIVIVYGYNN